MSTIEETLPVLEYEAPPITLPKPERRVGAFDGLRGLAVLMVIWGHAGFLFNAAVGVDIFFVLSGYLISAILLDELGKTGRIRFQNFYMRRVLRLAPALLLLIVLYLEASFVLRKSMGRALGDSAITLSYISNWTKAFGNRPKYLAHTWSLSIEEQFYLLWPVMVLGLYWLLGRTRKAGVVCLLGAVGIMFYRHGMEARGAARPDLSVETALRTFYRIYFGLDTRGDALLAGAALAFWTPKIYKPLAILVGWAGVVAMLWYLFSADLMTHFLLPSGQIDPNVYLWGTHISIPASLRYFGPHPYAYIWAFTLAILLGILNDRNGLLARLLSLKPLAWVGVISYGLYLFHFPIMIQLGEWTLGWWGAWTGNRWIVAGVGVPLTFGVATISYYVLERPCLKLKDRFRSRKDAAASSSKIPLLRRPYAAEQQSQAPSGAEPG